MYMNNPTGVLSRPPGTRPIRLHHFRTWSGGGCGGGGGGSGGGEEEKLDSSSGADAAAGCCSRKRANAGGGGGSSNGSTAITIAAPGAVTGNANGDAGNTVSEV